MGKLFKPTTSKVRSPFESNPWEPAQQPIQQGLSSAQDALTSGLGDIGGIQDYTANLTGKQNHFINDMMTMGAYNRNLGTSQVGSGQTIMGQALPGLESFGQAGANFQDLYNRAGQDRTGAILSGAQQYADNPYIQQQIDSAISDVNRGFQDTRSSINSGAVGSGNINSTRAGVLDAMAQDDAMDRAANISTGMRSQAYAQGLDRATAEQARMFGDQFGVNSAIGQHGMNAGALAGQGANIAGQGAQTRQGASQYAYDAASLYQQQAQNEISGRIMGAQAPMDLVNSYMGIVGRPFGTKGFQTQVSQGQSPFQTIVGGASALMGGYGTMMGG